MWYVFCCCLVRVIMSQGSDIMVVATNAQVFPVLRSLWNSVATERWASNRCCIWGDRYKASEYDQRNKPSCRVPGASK